VICDIRNFAFKLWIIKDLKKVKWFSNDFFALSSCWEQLVYYRTVGGYGSVIVLCCFERSLFLHSNWISCHILIRSYDKGPEAGIDNWYCWIHEKLNLHFTFVILIYGTPTDRSVNYPQLKTLFTVCETLS